MIGAIGERKTLLAITILLQIMLQDSDSAISSVSPTKSLSRLQFQTDPSLYMLLQGMKSA